MELVENTIYDTTNKNLKIRFLRKNDKGWYSYEKIFWYYSDYKDWKSTLIVETRLHCNVEWFKRNDIIGVSNYQSSKDWILL